MTSTPDTPTLVQRLAAIVAMLALLIAIAVVAIVALDNLGGIVIASIGLALAVVGCWYSLSRQGLVRVVAMLLIVVGVAMVVATLVAGDVTLWPWVLVAASASASVGAAGYALRSRRRVQVASVEAGPDPAPRHPVLLMNPKSGGGKAEKFELERECRERGIEPIVLAPGDDLRQLAEDAVARGADVIGMAGGDGSQALVASVAAHHDVPYVCVPAGTRNHLALDLGLDRADVLGAGRVHRRDRAPHRPGHGQRANVRQQRLARPVRRDRPVTHLPCGEAENHSDHAARPARRRRDPT